QNFCGLFFAPTPVADFNIHLDRAGVWIGFETFKYWPANPKSDQNIKNLRAGFNALHETFPFRFWFAGLRRNFFSNARKEPVAKFNTLYLVVFQFFESRLRGKI